MTGRKKGSSVSVDFPVKNGYNSYNALERKEKHMDPDSSNKNGKPVSEFVSRFFKGKKDGESKQMEEEIKNIMEEGNESGLLDDAQKNMIDNVFEFDDRTVSEIMTHRTDCVAVNVEGTLQDVLDLALEHGYLRIFWFC